MTDMPQVFFAYTADGQQFESIEAINADSARADIAMLYADKPTFLLRDTQVSTAGFHVRTTPVSICADLGSPNGEWIAMRLKIAVTDMMLLLRPGTPPDGKPHRCLMIPTL